MRELLGGAVLAAVLMGCSSTGPTQPPASALPTTTATARYGAPTVPSPRDVRGAAADPCRVLLSPSELRRLDYSASGQPTQPLGMTRGCLWRGVQTEKTADVAVWTSRDYFVDTYRNRVMAAFRPTTIAGAPAVEQQTGVNPGSCAVTVAVADSQALDLMVDVDERDDSGQPVVDPCAEGRRIAEAIISSLPPL